MASLKSVGDVSVLVATAIQNGSLSSSLSAAERNLVETEELLKNKTIEHQSSLLTMSRSVLSHRSSLASIKGTATQLYETAQENDTQLRLETEKLRFRYTQAQNVHKTLQLLRNVHRYLSLQRRFLSLLHMDTDVNKADYSERARAALVYNEIESLLSTCDLSQVDVVESTKETYSRASKALLSSADKVLSEGIASLSLTTLSGALVLLSHLNCLHEKVSTQLNSIFENTASIILSIGTIAVPDKKVIWSRFIRLSDALYQGLSQTKILQDAVLRANFQNQFGGTFFVETFWEKVNKRMTVKFDEIVKTSPQISQRIADDFYRIRRLFTDLSTKIKTTLVGTGIEADMLIGSLSPFESSFIKSMKNKLNEQVDIIVSKLDSNAESVTVKSNALIVSSAPEHLQTFTRTILLELDEARVSKHLLTRVKDAALEVLMRLHSQTEMRVDNSERAAQTTEPMCPQQIKNAAIFHALTQFLSSFTPFFSYGNRFHRVFERMRIIAESCVEELFDSEYAEIFELLCRMDSINFSLDSGNVTEVETMLIDIESSLLDFHMRFVRRLSPSEIRAALESDLAQRIATLFVRRICLLGPIGNAGVQCIQAISVRLENSLSLFAPNSQFRALNESAKLFAEIPSLIESNDKDKLRSTTLPVNYLLVRYTALCAPLTHYNFFGKMGLSETIRELCLRWEEKEEEFVEVVKTGLKKKGFKEPCFDVIEKREALLETVKASESKDEQESQSEDEKKAIHYELQETANEPEDEMKDVLDGINKSETPKDENKPKQTLNEMKTERINELEEKEVDNEETESAMQEDSQNKITRNKDDETLAPSTKLNENDGVESFPTLT